VINPTEPSISKQQIFVILGLVGLAQNGQGKQLWLQIRSLSYRLLQNRPSSDCPRLLRTFQSLSSPVQESPSNQYPLFPRHRSPPQNPTAPNPCTPRARYADTRRPLPTDSARRVHRMSRPAIPDRLLRIQDLHGEALVQHSVQGYRG
jgi:hypothetical protein